MVTSVKHYQEEKAETQKENNLHLIACSGNDCWESNNCIFPAVLVNIFRIKFHNYPKIQSKQLLKNMLSVYKKHDFVYRKKYLYVN